MRKTTLMMGRIISLCLAFVLGFFSAFGAIAGGIYYIYSGVSLDKLNEWLGKDIPLDEFVDPEAEKPVSSLTLQDLLAEIQQVKDDELTLKDMIDRYGLILPSDVVEGMPESIMNEIPFAALFTEEGIQMAMDRITVVEIIEMIPPEIAATILSNPARDALSDNTLSEIVEMDMGHVFEGIQLGYVSGVQYEMDENGVYQVVWADPENPTLLELIAPLDLGGVLSAVSDGEGDVLEVIKNSVGHVAVDSLFATFMDDTTILSGLLGEATLADVIVLDSETGEYTIDLMVAMEGRRVGSLLGYTEVESTDPETLETVYGWEDDEGNKIVGLSKKFADIYISELMDGTVAVDDLVNDLTIAEVLNYEKGEKLPVFMHDNYEEQVILGEDQEITVWYSDGKPADKMMNAFAGKDITWLGDSVSTLKLADILGYIMLDGEWYVWDVCEVNGADAIVLSPGSAVMAEIADTPIGELGSIEETLKDIKIGTLLGYTSVSDENGNHFWSTGDDEFGNPIKATGITASMSDLTINELADGTTLQSTIDDMSIADVMGYTKGDDGKFYKDGVEVTGPMVALADSKVGNLSDDINNVLIGEMLGYTPVYEADKEGVISHWLDGETKVEGIMAAFLDLSINDMKDNEKVTAAVQKVEIADALGLVYDEENDVWLNSDGTPTTGIIAVIADTSVGNLNDTLDTVLLGEIAGYKKLDADHPEATEGEGWYVYNSEDKTYTKATGVLAELSNLTVNELSDPNSSALTDNIGNVKLADALGYQKDSDGNWCDKSGAPLEGIMAALADKPINEMNSAVDNLKLKDVIPGEREGVLSIIDDETYINDIDTAIDDSVASTPLQFFIEKGIIVFEAETADTLDLLSNRKGEIVTLTQEQIDSGYYDLWIQENGSYDIPIWRTKELGSSFDYIVKLIQSPVTQTEE